MKDIKNSVTTKVDVIVPKEVKDVVNKIGNKTKIKSAYKIYNVLVRKSKYRNKEGWFEVQSLYLKSVNAKYKSIIEYFIKNNIIEPLVKIYQPGEKHGDLFNSVTRRTYHPEHNKCIHYRFNTKIDITKGETLTIEFENPIKDKRWYKLTKDSLERLGYVPKISRDGFGGRVYHNLTGCYKDDLHKKGFCVIDAQSSQPRLLYLSMKEKGIRDENLFRIFENELDFYMEMVSLFGIEDRNEAKNVFMYWAMGSGYTKGYNMWQHFPEACKFLKNVKGRNHKDSSRYLASKESKIFVDNLLENLPVNFGLTIHDSIIIHKKDANLVLGYCKDKYPELVFKIEEL